MTPHIDGPPQLLAPADTAKRISMSWRTVQRLVRDGEFPQPVRLSANRIGFYEAEVNAWIAARPRVSEAA